MSEHHKVAEEAKLAFTREYQKKIRFIGHLGIRTDALGAGSARLSVAVEPQLTNSMGTVHGGVIMSLLDVALFFTFPTIDGQPLLTNLSERASMLGSAIAVD